MRAESFVAKRKSAIATVRRKFHRMSQYVPSKYASDRAFSFGGMVSSQARVAVSGSVIPVGVAAGIGDGVVSCAGKELENVARATTRTTKRRVIPDSYVIRLA